MAAYSLGTMGAWAVTSHTDQIITGAKTFQTTVVAGVPLTVLGLTGQWNDLQQWRNSSGTVTASLSQDGRLHLGGSVGSLGPGSQLTVPTTSAGRVGIVVSGAASQTANLQEWQNSSGTVLTHVASDGSVAIGANNLAYLTVTSSATAAKGIIVRATASQTANLQEWQNSAGTVLSNIQAGGAFSTMQAVYTPLISSSTGSPLIISALGRLNWNNGVFIEQNNPTDYSTAFYAGTPATRAFYLDGQANANFGSQDSRVVINFPGTGGPGERRVLVGPPDSAGVGFRSLRTIN